MLLTHRSIFGIMMLFIVLFLYANGWAEEENRLMRDEVAVFKKKLVAIVTSLGNAPAGYIKEDENFYLPTEFYKDRNSGKITPIHASASQRFGGGAEKKRKKSQKEMEDYYQKKMAEAMAKGDYEAINRLTQEMQAKAGKAMMEEAEARKEPIEISIYLNSNPSQGIDPDNVVFEKPGVIALKFKEGGEDKVRVEVYFDPVSLKDTKTLSVVDLKMPKGGVEKRTAVLNATVRISGPSSEVEAWAKRIDTKAVLAQIDAAR